MSTIIYSRKGLSWLYYVLMVVFPILGLLLLMAALGQAVEQGPWSDKWLGVVSLAVAGFSWICGIPQMRTMARRYAGNVVRIDDVTVSLHSPGGRDIHFALADVTAVKWNPKMKARLCIVDTANGGVYSFDTQVCPKVKRVAAMIAERSGRELQVVSGE